MKISEFKINEKFIYLGGMHWLCTDIGTRTISAILLSPEKNEEWFYGPPYAVQEIVFDEDNIKECFSNIKESIDNSFNKNIHPGFSSKDVFKMLDECLEDEKKYTFYATDFKLLQADRVSSSFNILHPYSMIKKFDGFYIKVFDIFEHTYSIIHENNFIHYNIANELDFKRYISIQERRI